MSAYLFSGDPKSTVQHALDTLCALLCSSACKTCTTCLRVISREHFSVIWTAPEKKQYGVADISDILKLTVCALDDHEKRIIVLEYADQMTAPAANRLLKTLEEPPRGYFFMLLARRSEIILPTIRSRCMLVECEKQESRDFETFLELFDVPQQVSLERFSAVFEKASLDEHSSRDVLDALIMRTKNERIAQMLEKLPMPGSTKLFWRALFLELRR